MSSLFCLVPQDKHGDTALAGAGQENQLEVASVLLDGGATINYQNKVVNYLYRFIIKLNNISSQNGLTALHRACLKGHIDMIQFLINSGAQPDIKDKVSVESCAEMAMLQLSKSAMS